MIANLRKHDLLLILLVLVISNFLIRWAFDLHFASLPYYFDQENMNYQGTKWYTYMLPSMAKAWGGTWSSLGIGLFPILKEYIGNTNSYLLLNFLFITTAYFLSWFAFRSKIFTITLGICAAFTTLNDHVYQNSSLIVIYIPFILCFCNLFSLFKLFQDDAPKLYWWIIWGVSLFLYILSFEGWLDYYAVIMLASFFCFYILQKQNDSTRIKRLSIIITFLTMVAVVYVLLKVKYGYASNKGDEHDLVFNYGVHYLPLIMEDMISNFFTFFYSTIITYIPPLFSFSVAWLMYGPNKIINLQNEYDLSNAYLASVAAVTLWRFYAGVYITIFFYFGWQVSKKVFLAFNKDYFFIFIFMFMILIGAPCHMLVKFRSMHIIPWLPYQSFVGQIGMILLIAYLIKMLHQSSKSKMFIWIVTSLIWISIISCAFLKPSFYKAGENYGHLGFQVPITSYAIAKE